MATTPGFTRALEHLRDTEEAVAPLDLFAFSSLSRDDVSALEAAWPEITVERRRGLLADLAELAEANLEVSFEAVFRLGLEDEDAEARAASVAALWEVEDSGLIAPFLHLLQTDPETTVRAAAASALGRFVYLGELNDLPAAKTRRVEAALLAVIDGPDEAEVRRRALEAVSYSSRPEIAPLIRAAFDSQEPGFRASALFAMGRSADEQWETRVLLELQSAAPELRFEAARAAGELELSESVASLTDLLDDPDPQVRDAAIWSLGQIGGPEARQTLQRLLDEADEDEQDYISDALEFMDFADDVHSFGLLDLDDNDDDPLN